MKEEIGGNSAERLRAYVERIEALEEEKRGLAGDIKDIYVEVKAAGFDKATVREVVALRRLDPEKRRMKEELLDQYRHALGMLATTPLGEAAMRRVGE